MLVVHPETVMDWIGVALVVAASAGFGSALVVSLKLHFETRNAEGEN